MAKITEGYMPFKGFKTYYRVVGERKDNGKAPLILAHGGPGSTHNYFELLDCVADMDDRQLVMYDQLGCGNSYLDRHPELWVQETWAEELVELRKHLDLDTCHLLGQSWGGMLCHIYACDYEHEGLKSLILSSTLSNAALWRKELLRRMKYLSPEDREAIEFAEKEQYFYGDDYMKAYDDFMTRYCNYEVPEDAPDCLKRFKKTGKEAYFFAWGDNEFSPNGTLKDFDYSEKRKHIDVPCLIMSGAEDICSPLVAKDMYDNIPDAEWHLFANSRHVCFVEETEEYLEVLLDWLNRKDK